MIQIAFANRVREILSKDEDIVALGVGGSWITNELDEFSDLDLIIVTREKISDQPSKMLEYAHRLGTLLSAFVGDHVGEPRLLICLYDNPLLHVDLKFVTLLESQSRIETPYILYDPKNQLATALEYSAARPVKPNFQWIEDRFWTWIHYVSQKTMRGEYLEALDFFAFLRATVLGPLIQLRNNNLPRGVRFVESKLTPEDYGLLLKTVPEYNRSSLFRALDASISLYRDLRSAIFPSQIKLNSEAEEKVIQYLNKINNVD